MIPMMLLRMMDENDSEFIQELFLRNEKLMYAMALKIVKDHHTACDMVSAACLTMIQKIDYLRRIQPHKMTPYILSIVRNTALMYLRKRKRENLYMIDDDRLFDLGTSLCSEVDDALIAEAETQILRSALHSIDKLERELLVMKYFEQCSDEEIAVQMGIGTNSVRYYLTKARRSLKEALKGEES